MQILKLSNASFRFDRDRKGNSSWVCIDGKMQGITANMIAPRDLGKILTIKAVEMKLGTIQDFATFKAPIKHAPISAGSSSPKNDGKIRIPICRVAA